MPWITQQSPTMAELFGTGAISGGGGISPALLQPRRNRWEEAFAKIAPIIKEQIQKKKSDQFKNYVMNMYQPPRAEAVDPSLQGLPPTMPFTGGDEGFQALELYRKMQEHTEDRDLKRRQVEAQINAKGESRVPVEAGGRTYHVTDNQALDHFDRVRKANEPDKMTPYQREQLLYKTIPQYSTPIARGKLDKDGMFTNQYTGAEQGEMLQLRTPDGDTIVVPWSAYQEQQMQTAPNPAAESYRSIQPKEVGQDTGKVKVRGKDGKTYFVSREKLSGALAAGYTQVQ